MAGGDPINAEYLYWVGCAGSFDDKNKKVTRAMAQLMERAGVDFAILGPAENCTGDSARRAGNEYLFQMLASANIETLNSMGVRKIVTQCPHCFNTLANEYPQLGGHYEVIHHSQLLDALVAEGRLDLGGRLPRRAGGLPRQLLSGPPQRRVPGPPAGARLPRRDRPGGGPPQRHQGEGAAARGGARMWMEETIGTKVNDERSRELLDTGASRIATACPFCYIMMDDGVRAAGVDEDSVLSRRHSPARAGGGRGPRRPRRRLSASCRPSKPATPPPAPSVAGVGPRIAVIDNYDSFVYILVQYLGELGAEPLVYRHDAVTADEVRALEPDGILISPGPGTPDDAGVSNDVLATLSGAVPIFGVCLGMQCIGQAFGADVIRAPEVMHGKTSVIEHDSTGVFEGLPSPLTATRYHSLIVEHSSVPPELEVTATCDGGLVMGLRHRRHLTEGVQFHPESVLTDEGRSLLDNFLARCR